MTTSNITPTEDTTPRRQGVLQRVLTTGVGIGLLVAVVYIAGTENLADLRHLRVLPTALAALSSLGVTGLVALRWGVLVNALAGEKVASWTDYYHYHIVSRSIGFLLPKDIADVSGRTAWLYQTGRVSVVQGGASVLLDRLYDFANNLVFVLAVIPYWAGWVNASTGWGIVLALPVIMGGVFYVFFDTTVSLLRWLYQTMRRIKLVARRLPETPNLGDLDRGTLVRAYMLSTAKGWFMIARFVLIGLAVSPPIPAGQIVFAMPLAQLSYALAFTPGGLGIFEAGWLAALTLSEVAAESISLYLISQRLIIMVSILLLGLLSQARFVIAGRRAKASGPQ